MCAFFSLFGNLLIFSELLSKSVMMFIWSEHICHSLWSCSFGLSVWPSLWWFGNFYSFVMGLMSGWLQNRGAYHIKVSLVGHEWRMNTFALITCHSSHFFWIIHYLATLGSYSRWWQIVDVSLDSIWVPCFWLFSKLSMLLVLLISIPATNDFVPEDKLRQNFWDFLDLGLCACAMMIIVISKILYTLRQ